MYVNSHLGEKKMLVVFLREYSYSIRPACELIPPVPIYWQNFGGCTRHSTEVREGIETGISPLPFFELVKLPELMTFSLLLVFFLST